MSTITGDNVQDMVSDWLQTPVNAYLGSSYGQDLKRVLHNPMATPMADQQLAKLRGDVPVLQALPAGAVNLYSAADPDRIDRLQLFVEVAGRAIEFTGR